MAEAALMRFSQSDQFLRRVRYYGQFSKNGLVRWNAFKEKDARMSWTLRRDNLLTDAGLDEYHNYWSNRVGECLPAILWFNHIGLTQKIEPPFVPEHDPDQDDQQYGHLHCSTDSPRDDVHMKLLAKLVHDGEYAGIARRYAKPNTPSTPVT